MPIFKSLEKDIPIPDTDIYNFVFADNEQNTKINKETHPAFIDGNTGKTITYAQVVRDTKRFAAGLQDKYGFKKGDVLAMFAPNQVDYPTVLFGTLAARGTVSTANPAYTATELVHQLRDSNAKYVVTISELLSVVREAAELCGIPDDQILLFGDKAEGPFKPYTSIMSSRQAEPPRAGEIDPRKDVAFLSYSSGTTGLAKGVMLSHRNVVTNCCQVSTFDRENILPGDCWIGFLPFYHIYGLNNLLHLGLYMTVPVVVMPKFDLVQFLELIQKYKVTLALIVPPIALLLAKHPIVDNYDLSSVRLFSSGAAPLSKELVEAVVNRLGVAVRQGYGMTEMSPTSHVLRYNDWKVYGSIGPLLANLECKVVDEEDNILDVNQAGEILIRGDNVMLGYLNNPEANAKTFDKDGFLRTGDVGYRDEKGYYYIVDRVKELIKYKGFQVPPAEIEALLVSHPKVSDVGVIGVYSPDDATELPRAYVVPAPGNTPSPQLAKELEDFVASKVANHKKLRGGVRFVDEIPKSAAGKILRRLMRDNAKKEMEETKTKAKL